METKILVASPTFSGMAYCDDVFLDRIQHLAYDPYDLLLVDNSRTKEYYAKLSQLPKAIVLYDDTQEELSINRLISSRNLILTYAIKHNYSHILMIDSDVIPPKNILSELLACNKDLVSGLCYNYFNIGGKLKFLPVAWKYFTPEEFTEYKKITQHQDITITDVKRHLTQEEVDSNELHEVAIPTAGCMLISRNVFTKVRYARLKKDGKEVGTGEDIHFLNEAKQLGFVPYCNTKIKCLHITEGKYVQDEQGRIVHSSFVDLI